MPFSQSGDNATANISGTYNDVNGDQHNTTNATSGGNMENRHVEANDVIGNGKFSIFNYSLAPSLFQYCTLGAKQVKKIGMMSALRSASRPNSPLLDSLIPLGNRELRKYNNS